MWGDTLYKHEINSQMVLESKKQSTNGSHYYHRVITDLRTVSFTKRLLRLWEVNQNEHAHFIRFSVKEVSANILK